MRSCGMGKKRIRRDRPSAYAIMWLVVMFDLPVGTKAEMRRATAFRNSLLELGFTRKQFSVYLRHCESLEKAQRIADEVGHCLVENGSVSVMFFTDRQYGMTRNYMGKTKKRNEKQELDAGGQLFLF